MPRIVSIANQKGGCGKTTSTMNLAGALTRIGYRVLVADADLQASATRWSTAQGQAALPFDVVSSGYLKRFDALDAMPHDIALVDCPSGVAHASPAAHFARECMQRGDAILVPLQPSSLDFDAAVAFLRYLAAEVRPDVRIGALVNGRQRNLLGQRARANASLLFAAVAQLFEFPAHIFAAEIGWRTSITEVSGSGKTIFDYAPRSTAAQEYLNLTKEFIQWLLPEQESTSAPSKLSTVPSPLSSAAPSL